MDPAKHLLLQALLKDGSVALRTIDNPAFRHFRTKPYAVYHASFEQVLLLDCDNIPLRDPSYLFEFLETTTAIFWPDYWQPSYSIFNVHAQSLLWQYLDMPFLGGFEQESGQVLVDRRASASALHKLMFYTIGPSSDASLVFLNSKRLLYGDKDLFRLAWANTSTPVHFIDEPPAFAGVYRWWLSKFCGLSIIQFDMHGHMVFLHRNMAKLNGDPRQVPVLLDIARFNTTKYNVSEHYQVECKGRQLGGKLCWGFKWPFVPYDVTPMASDHPIRRVEAQVLQYAIDAGTLGRLHHLYDNDPPTGWYQLDLLLGLGTLSVVASFAYRRVLCRRPRKKIAIASSSLI